MSRKPGNFCFATYFIKKHINWLLEFKNVPNYVAKSEALNWMLRKISGGLHFIFPNLKITDGFIKCGNSIIDHLLLHRDFKIFNYKKMPLSQLFVSIETLSKQYCKVCFIAKAMLLIWPTFLIIYSFENRFSLTTDLEI